MTELKGKAIVVTGAGRGIGAAYARGFAKLGAHVVVNDVTPGTAESLAEELVAQGLSAIAHSCDISDWTAAGGLMEACVATFGAIDGLVNNGGIFRMARIDEVCDATDIESLLRINVAGTFHCAAHAVGHMKAAGSGSIVNITSGAQMGIPAMGAYGATKGAVASLTYTWAMELKDLGIRVNAISPMAFTQQSGVATEYHAARGKNLDRAKLVAPESNMPVAAFLLSDLSAGVTGQVFRIDDTQLSLVSHPAIINPVIERQAWTVQGVAEAFSDHLSAHMAPLGLIGVDIAANGAVRVR